MEIRKIKKEDNGQVAHLIRSILKDMGVPKVGTAYADKAPLDNYAGNLCELQKLYVASRYRGKGLAKKVLGACFKAAKDFGFEGCYLETLPNMEAAQQLYLKNGFEYLKEPLGETGHSACSVRMLKTFK